MTSILAYGEGNYEFSQEDVFKLMDRIQAFIKNGTPKCGQDLPYVEEYPASARDLPHSLKKAYGGALPVDVEIPELDAVLAGKKQRGRRKCASPAWLESVPAEHRAVFMASVRKKECNQNPCNTETDSTLSGNESSTNLAKTLQDMRAAMKPPVFQQATGTDPGKTAPAADESREHVDEEHAETGSHDDELEEMEAEMRKAVHKREAGKKKEGTLPKKKDPLKKKPAAKHEEEPLEKRKKVAKPSAKRPAAAMDKPEFSAKARAVARKIDMKDIFRRLSQRIDEPGMCRGKLVGWVYGHGRHRAELQGAPDEVCKEVGSIMSAQAGKICGGKL